MAVTRVHKDLPTRGPETNFGTQIQQKIKNIAASRVDKLFPTPEPETNYFLRMA